jgi:hypothetical protein
MWLSSLPFPVPSSWLAHTGLLITSNAPFPPPPDEAPPLQATQPPWNPWEASPTTSNPLLFPPRQPETDPPPSHQTLMLQFTWSVMQWSTASYHHAACLLDLTGTMLSTALSMPLIRDSTEPTNKWKSSHPFSMKSGSLPHTATSPMPSLAPLPAAA